MRNEVRVLITLVIIWKTDRNTEKLRRRWHFSLLKLMCPIRNWRKSVLSICICSEVFATLEDVLYKEVQEALCNEFKIVLYELFLFPVDLFQFKPKSVTRWIWSLFQHSLCFTHTTCIHYVLPHSFLALTSTDPSPITIAFSPFFFSQCSYACSVSSLRFDMLTARSKGQCCTRT